MDKENILKVADAIEQHSIPGLGFNMNVLHFQYHEDKSGYGCGTCACIAGWACAIGNITPPSFEAAANFLGLDINNEGDELFWAGDFNLGRIELPQAVAALRHLAATGEVDWERALQPA